MQPKTQAVVALAIASMTLLVACPPERQTSGLPVEDAGYPDDTEVTDDADVDTQPGPAEIVFADEELLLIVNAPQRPEAQVLDDEGEVLEGAAITWESADTSIVEISSGGFAIGVAPGTTELTASHGDVQAQLPVRVVDVPVGEVYVVPEEATISVGWELPYMVNLRDENGSVITGERPITWSTTDPDVASIDADGIVEAQAAGDVEIVALVEGVEGRADLTVVDVDVESIEISPAFPSPILRGQQLQLTATAYDIESNPLEGYVVDWSSDDHSVATVDATGLVTAVESGTATITADLDGLQDSVEVEVYFLLGEIAAGGGFACAVAAQRLHCWGENDGGQLGDGTFEPRDEPTPSEFDGSVDALSLGDAHGCLVDSDGEIWCWGANDAGQVGEPAGNDASSPQPLEAGIVFTDVSAGAQHTCGLAASGQVYCWGANGEYQLGTQGGATHVPDVVSGVSNVRAVAAGGRHTCAIAGDDSTYCWGANDRKQLGGSTTAERSHTPQLVDGGYEFDALSAGGDHTCASDSSGPSACWGANDRGQLGSGGTADQGVPLTLSLQPGEGMIAVGGGALHSCGLLAGGSPRCWGAYEDGRLGTEATDDATEPQPIDGDHQFTEITVGLAHACARAQNQRLFCWGGDPADGAAAAEIEF